MKRFGGLLLFIIITSGSNAQTLQKTYPVDFSKVVITDSFWLPKQRAVATATLKACIDYTENKTGRIRNFEKAATHKKGKHEGIYYDDSDVYKAIEAMSYSLHAFPNPYIESKIEEWIDKIAAAQLPDGYLNTYYVLTGIENRWSDMEKHEDYCAGHLIEAAIAYANATGKRKLLAVATKFADHIDNTFRLANRPWVTGHQEIELALMKLFHYTGNKKYLSLAQYFLDQRGRGYGKGVIWDDWKNPKYCQDDLPVKDQTEIEGHAVRAMYLYTGAADVAAVTNDAGYMNAMKTIWQDVVYRNMYITGGIGALSTNEGFGEDYDLPNENAYSETCASVGMVFWNQRMNMLTGETRYIDVLERSLYNAALDGLSLSGDRFFYGNPLASSGRHARREWFGTACCPSNIARLVSSAGNYIYATAPKAVYVNLFVGSKSYINTNGLQANIELHTNYPWSGNTTLKIDPSQKEEFTLNVRIPGWVNKPVPGDLYSYTDDKDSKPEIFINQKPVIYALANGYAAIKRKWNKGDIVEINFPMEVRLIKSNDSVKANKDRVAIQYGPLVYCLEGRDNNENAWNILMTDKTRFEVEYKKDLLGGVNVIRFNAQELIPSPDGKSVVTTKKIFTAIPYFTWNNRGAGEMQVWLPQSIEDVRINYGR